MEDSQQRSRAEEPSPRPSDGTEDAGPHVSTPVASGLPERCGPEVINGVLCRPIDPSAPYLAILDTAEPPDVGRRPDGAGWAVDHRWRLAVARVRARVPVWYRPQGDWVTLAQLYVRAVLACPDAKARVAVARRMPGVEDAYRLRTTPDRLARGVVEARLLAGLPAAAVAAACGLTPQAVAVYEALFFNVRGALKAPEYILHAALGPKHVARWDRTLRDVDVLVKWAGYLHGTTLVDDLMRYLTRGCLVPEREGEPRPDQFEEAYRGVLMGFLVWAWLLPVEKAPQAVRVERRRRHLEALLEGRPAPRRRASLWPEDADEAPAPAAARSPALRAALSAWAGQWRQLLLTWAMTRAAGEARRGELRNLLLLLEPAGPAGATEGGAHDEV